MVHHSCDICFVQLNDEAAAAAGSPADQTVECARQRFSSADMEIQYSSPPLSTVTLLIPLPLPQPSTLPGSATDLCGKRQPQHHRGRRQERSWYAMRIGVSVDTGARALLTIGIWPMKFYNLKKLNFLFLFCGLYSSKRWSRVS